ncbi:hypothetical protein RJT34_19767 [Clitoria ternatea]|uniref:Uncharacterized protein n=1 Tax=Clitoria ternatea TaxID=43366 RepID=A0AAN9IRX3_CLITE
MIVNGDVTMQRWFNKNKEARLDRLHLYIEKLDKDQVLLRLTMDNVTMQTPEDVSGGAGDNVEGDDVFVEGDCNFNKLGEWDLNDFDPKVFKLDITGSNSDEEVLYLDGAYDGKKRCFAIY